MDLKFLVSVIVFLAGIWAYLYKKIMDLTLKNPAEGTLFLLGYMHFVVFAYIVMALIELYYMGATSSQGQLPRLTTIFLQTWPLALISLLIAFLLVKISESHFALSAVFYIFVGLTVLAAVYKLTRREDPRFVILFFFGLAFAGILYLLGMSFFLADVEITTDKQFYKDTENVILSVRAGGYVFRPYMYDLKFGLYKKEGQIHDATVLVTPKDHCGSDLIMVDYRPQAISVKRTAFLSIKMART